MGKNQSLDGSVKFLLSYVVGIGPVMVKVLVPAELHGQNRNGEADYSFCHNKYRILNKQSNQIKNGSYSRSGQDDNSLDACQWGSESTWANPW